MMPDDYQQPFPRKPSWMTGEEPDALELWESHKAEAGEPTIPGLGDVLETADASEPDEQSLDEYIREVEGELDEPVEPGPTPEDLVHQRAAGRRQARQGVPQDNQARQPDVPPQLPDAEAGDGGHLQEIKALLERAVGHLEKMAEQDVARFS